MRYFHLTLLFAFIFNAATGFEQTGSDSTSLDADPVQQQVKLLPDNLGFIKRTLWGEHGLVRVLNLSP